MALTLTRPLMVSVTLAERMLAEPGGSLGHMPVGKMKKIMDDLGGSSKRACRRGCGTDLFAVVNSVGLKVVANVGHDEKGGDVAQLLAPAILVLEESGLDQRVMKAPDKRGVKGIPRANFVHPGAHPTFDKKLQQTTQLANRRAQVSGQTCFSSGVDGVAHGLLARNALLGGHGALKSGDALRH
jgi:hypothetical protein